MVYGVFVSYYPEYKETSFIEFIDILKRTNQEFSIIVVNNNKQSNVFDKKQIDSVLEIVGTNSGWEFSAWDEAIQFIRSNIKNLTANDYFVFANDTFNQHRFFNFYDKHLFVSAFLKNMKNDVPLLVGEVNSFNQEFSVASYAGNNWVSSYLFFANLKLIESINKFDVINALVPDSVASIEDGVIKFDHLISLNLACHLNSWFFPKKKSKGWYGSGNSDKQLLFLKIKAILNEKLLSLRCVENGLLIDVYSSMVSRFYLRLKYYLYNKIR